MGIFYKVASQVFVRLLIYQISNFLSFMVLSCWRVKIKIIENQLNFSQGCNTRYSFLFMKSFFWTPA